MSDQAPTTRLMTMLQPVLAKVEELAPERCTDDESTAALLSELDAAFPYDAEAVQEIGAQIRKGIEEGWLCDRGEANARFCRLSKASPTTHDLSIDVVSLSGPAVPHTHPRGEVTLGFPSTGEGGTVRFDGHPPGWVCMAPGSRHTPTVDGGRMDLIYFLPGGAVQWHPEG